MSAKVISHICIGVGPVFISSATCQTSRSLVYTCIMKHAKKLKGTYTNDLDL